MLKIISGNNRGRKIIFPFGEKTRPTSNMVKEAIFNIIQFDIINSNFLDLFSGSGQIGLEAISRGASYVTFVDHDKICQKYLIKNLKNMNIQDKFDIINSDALLYLSRANKIFDIIFLDPPYNQGLSDKILNIIIKNVSKTGIVIVETEKKEVLKTDY
ncbi:MAG: 16S rRNA (guanine(966)-N(2))-methyltransferase RsmD, partial [Oscillospiraceae bacterium]|nr:16S rRNA (guanine(966)-N(2))-methyltransferase RsmD [Oscillospiraceae bacterium]